mmetsp:Transcript_22406/g.31310  ORF Transcript_22406/g.31310 Transcript_22406/m.31310 type:complete len:315 (+) Transcript_22406:624-1568(+)
MGIENDKKAFWHCAMCEYDCCGKCSESKVFRILLEIRRNYSNGIKTNQNSEYTAATKFQILKANEFGELYEEITNGCDVLSHSAIKKIVLRQSRRRRRRRDLLCVHSSSNLSPTTITTTRGGVGGRGGGGGGGGGDKSFESKHKEESTTREEKEEAGKEQLPEEEEKEMSSPSLCQICFDDSVNVVLTCGHEFCEDCLNDWTKKRNRESVCPMCREPLHDGVDDDDDDDTKRNKKKRKWTSEVGWVLASEDDEMIKLAALALAKIWDKVLHSNKEVVPASAISVFGESMTIITAGNVDEVCRRISVTRLNSIFT